MMSNWLEKIDAYLQNELSPEQRLEFEEILKSDESLSEEFNIYREIEMEMKCKEKYSSDEKALKKSLEKLNAVYFSDDNTDTKKPTPVENLSATGPKKEVKGWKWMAMAACLLSIILVGKFYLEKKNNAPEKLVINQYSLDSLYDQNFSPDRFPAVSEGPLLAVHNPYVNKDYPAAYKAIDNINYSIVTRGAENDSVVIKLYASYYKAQCLMAMNDAAKAVPELEKLLENAKTDLPETTIKWYLALAYLKTGSIEGSIKLLGEVSLDNSLPEHKQAAVLLKQLNQR